MKIVCIFALFLLVKDATPFLQASRGRSLTEGFDEIRPAPPSIGADVPLTYFGPAPSTVQKELIGPFQLLTSGTVNQDEGTISLPLYRGSTPGKNQTYYYVVTDTSDQGNAAALGINFSAKLGYASALKESAAYRKGVLDNRLLLETSNGWVDFSPALNIQPGDAPNYFPPTTSEPGSVGMDDYTPLVSIGGVIYNAPIVAGDVELETLSQYCNGIPKEKAAEAYTYLHDKVVAICPSEEGTGGTVTLSLTTGFSFARPVLYLSLDASAELPAAMEAVNYAPALGFLPVGGDDSLFSAVERIFTVVNGYTNADVPDGFDSSGTYALNHPSRQGFNSALRGDGSPLNVLGGIPTIATDYSPMWDLNVAQWTPESVDAGFRVRLLEEFQILGLVARGFMTGPDGAPFGSLGAIVNCPIVHRFL